MKNLYFKKTPHIFSYAIFLILGIIILAGRLYQLQNKKAPESQRVFSIDVYPQGEVTLPENITIVTNEKVDPHVLEHHFFISPEIPGTISLTDSGYYTYTYTFTPTEPFARGVRYAIKIENGLIGETGLLLAENVYKNFHTELADGTIQFVKNGLAGKVLSFAANTPISLQIKSAKTIDTIKTNLYKSSQVELLAYLSYVPNKDENRGTYYLYRGEFHKSSVPHDKTQLIESKQLENPSVDVTYNLAPGIYYLEATGIDDLPIGATFLIVNKTGIIFRQDDQHVVLSAFDLATNEPVADPIHLDFYATETSPKVIASHTLSGMGTFPYAFDDRLDVVLARRGEEQMLVPVQLPFSQADIQMTNDLSKKFQFFVYTDRPIYKPNDIVNFRGVVRVDNDGMYTLPAEGTAVYINAGLQNVPLITAYTNKEGVFWGNFKIPSESDGEFQMSVYGEKANTYQASYGYAYYSVEQYTKPEYDLAVRVEQQEYLRSDTPVFYVKGTRFDGKSSAGQIVTITQYSDVFFETQKEVYNANFNITAQGGMCGAGGFGYDYYGAQIARETVTLDKNGEARIAVDVKKKQDLYSQKWTVVAEQIDNANNLIVGAASTIVHAADTVVFFTPSVDRYRQGEEVVMPFYAEKLSGEKVANTTMKYVLTDARYNEVVDEKSVPIATGEITTDAVGRGIIRYVLPNDIKSTSYDMFVLTKDQKGNEVQAKKVFYVYAKDQKQIQQDYWERQNPSQTYLKIVSEKNSFVVGDTIRLTVRSPKKIDALLSLERGRVYVPQVVHLQEGETTIEIPVTTMLSPSATAVFSFFADGAYHTEGLSLNIPAMHQLLTVTVASDKPEYTKGEIAMLSVHTSDYTNAPVSAKFSLSVVDRAIFALKKSATPPMHSSFYYFRPRKTNTSSSLTWIGTYNEGGRGGGGGGGGGPTRLVDTLYWNPDLQTNSDGNATVSVPLGDTVTIWRTSIFASTDKTQVGQASLDFSVK